MKPKGSKTLEVIQTKGTQFASVPNSLAGREWLHQLRGYLNRGEFRIVALRGRAKDRRRKGGNREDIPARRADWLAVYIERKRPSEPAPCEPRPDRYGEGYNAGYRTALESLRSALRPAVESLRELTDELEDGICVPTPAPSAGAEREPDPPRVIPIQQMSDADLLSKRIGERIDRC